MTDTSVQESAPTKKPIKKEKHFMTLDELCKELKIKKTKARRLLRAAPDIKHKANAAWEFDADASRKAKAILTAK
jgi:hypothetical protein